MVGGASYRNDAVLVGRDLETARLLTAMGGSTDSPAATIVVHGEAGIGKTALVAGAVTAFREFDSDAVILRGVCLPLVSLTVPFIGIRSALRDALRAAPEPLPPLPDLDTSPTRVPVLLDRWIEETTCGRRLVMTIDDLQWADQNTLDALLYLAAGPAERPLTLIGTIRDEDDTQTRAVDQWVADARRMPRVDVLRLGLLDRAGTDAQVSALLGWPPDQSLVEEIFVKTQGHPYLTELTVAGVAPDADHLPHDLPDSVTSAVLGAVRALSADTQAMLGPLAAAGRPLSPTSLGQALADGGFVLPTDRSLRALLDEALHTGVIVEGAGGVWFRHPLSAEVIEEGLEVDDRHRWHRVLAEFETRTEPAPGEGLARSLRIADHRYHSGDVESAYRSALESADSARDADAGPQELRLLLRALELRPRVARTGLSRHELLRRARRAAEAAGALDDELEIVEDVLNSAELTDLVRAEFLMRRMRLRSITQQEYNPLDACEAILEMTRPHSRSWQHAKALTLWVNSRLELCATPEPAVVSAVESAVALARDAGHAATLAEALAADGWVRLAGGDRAAAAEAFAEASATALAAREWVAFNDAAQGVNALTETWSSEEVARLLHASVQELLIAGAPHVYVAWLANAEAAAWLYIGEWERCREVLRFIVGRDPGRYTATAARITAARLALLQGHQADAEAHVARIHELTPTHRRFAMRGAVVIRSEVMLAAHDPEGALRVAMEVLEQDELPDFGEWLMPLATRALADLAERHREHGDSLSKVLEELESLLDAHPRVRMGAAPVGELARAREVALNALVASETRRARRSADEVGSWSITADAMKAAQLPWEEAYACQRLAESLLRGTGGARRLGSAKVAIRRGLVLADRLHAAPVAASLRRLAGAAHISVDGDQEHGMTPDPDRLSLHPRLQSLTHREYEVLAHMIAGDTYAETASALFISEKTVSAHVSHLLTKTGTSNRVELAQLAGAESPLLR